MPKKPINVALKCGADVKVQMVTHVLFKCMLENSAEQGLGSRVVKDFSEDILGKSPTRNIAHVTCMFHAKR